MKRKESKKVDGGGDCTRYGQVHKNLFSKIKTQTFTMLKSVFFFSIKNAQKLILKGSICRAVLIRFCALFLRFLPKIKSLLFFQNRRLKLKRSGYVLILMIISIPVLLFGIKYVMDKMTENEVKIDQVKGTLTYYKKCAQEAALAVAKNWNPGLNLSYQKNALMKVVDAIYNDSPCYIQGNTNLYEAVPGLDIKSTPQLTHTDEKFVPIKVDYAADQMITQTSVMASKEIKYTNANKYLLRYYRGYYTTASDGTGGGYENVYHRIWRETDLNTNPSYRYSYFDEIDETKRANHQYELIHHDIYGLPCRANPTDLLAKKNAQGQLYYPNNSFFWPGSSDTHNRFAMTIPSTSTSVSQYSPWKYHTSSTVSGNLKSVKKTYKKRTTPSGTDPVTISIDNDRIKVTTDSSIGYPGTVAYAKPAELNVDIVLAIPVNGAASNINNNDTASPTAEYPSTANEYGQSSTYPTETTPTFSVNTKNTPIYQMGQACKNFVKDNFYHIKGVTMGLIPYSAKVSISPDKTGYTIAIPQFAEFTPWTNPLYPTAAMYGTRGEAGAALVNSYVWNTILTGCPIMCRRGDTFGNLLSNAAPSSGDQHKYMRMNLNPCLAGYANQLSMKCERKCTTYFPNPYYMIEPTADMVKIYEMCNALFPVYDPNNVSNFLFIPFEWANNFWQSWTSDVKTSAGADTLSRPSKTTSGRKKVLVMLVNKPDWFEPGEMTYLGFDNDYSLVPLAESDKIDFRINYGDTSKKFLDGSCYNTEYTSGEFKGIKNKNSDGTPLIAGPKKIIRFENQSGIARNNSTGDVECTGSGTGRLYIPRQAMVRLTVASTAGTIQFTNIGDTTTYTIRDEKTFTIPASNVTSTSGSEYYVEFKVSKLKLISAEVTNIGYTYVQPINTSYNEVEWIGQGGSNTNIKWGKRTEIEVYQDEEEYDCSYEEEYDCPYEEEYDCSYEEEYDCTIPKTCTRRVPKTCTRPVTKYGPGTVDLTSIGGGMKVSDGFKLGSTYGWRWYYFPQALNKEGDSRYDWECGIAYDGSKFVTMSKEGYPAYSTDYGLTWKKPDRVEPPMNRVWNSIVWNGSYFVILTNYGGYSTYSSDGSSWNTPTFSVGNVYSEYLDDDLLYNNSDMFAMGDNDCIYATNDKTGTSGWIEYGCKDTTHLCDGEKWKYGNGTYLKYCRNTSSLARNSTLRLTYTDINWPDDFPNIASINYGNSYWLGLSYYGDLMKSSDSSAQSWSMVNDHLSYISGGGGDWSGLCYGNSRWVANTTDGDIAILTRDTIFDNGEPAYTYHDGSFSITPTSENVYRSETNGWFTNTMNTEETIRIYSPVYTEMTLTVSSYKPTNIPPASITFFDDYDSITQNVGTHVISGSKTFTFSGYSSISSSSYTPGPNFGNNYGIEKIRYTGKNISLEAYIPAGKQLLRCERHREDMSVYSNLGEGSSDLKWSVYIGFMGVHSGYFYWDIEPDVTCDYPSCTDCANNGTFLYFSFLCGNSIHFDNDYYGNSLYGDQKLTSYYKLIYNNVTSKKTCNGNQYNLSGSTMDGIEDKNPSIMMLLRSPNGCFRVNRFFCRNIAKKEWGGMNRPNIDITNNLCVTADDEFIKFAGDSQCKVTVTAKTTPDPSYVRVNSATNDSLTTTIPESAWIKSGDRYYVDLHFKNAKLLKIYQPNQTVSESYDCSYDDPYDCSVPKTCTRTVPKTCTRTVPKTCTKPVPKTCTRTVQKKCRRTVPKTCTKTVSRERSVIYPALRAKSACTVTYSYVDSGTRYVKTTKSSDFSEDDQDGDYKYYIKLPSTAAVGKFAARKYSVTEAVYDMIDFSANTTGNKNGCLSTNFNGTYSNNFYYFGSSSVTKTLTTNTKGNLILKVAPSFYADSGSIKMNYGDDTVAKTVTAPMILTIKYSDLSNDTMQFTLKNCVILYAKLCNVEANISPPPLNNSYQSLVWNSSSVLTSGTNISLSGTYSNYRSDWGWHKLKYQSIDSDRLRVWNNSYISDINSVLNAKQSTLAYWYMPQNIYTDFENTNLVGPMRLFSPMTRDSSLTPRKYCQMFAHDGHENMADLLWHNFTLPGNLVLINAEYQSAGEDATAAVKRATAAVCAKLKTDYGDDLRVYVVKYRKQAQYKTFPAYNVTQSNVNHDYSVIDKCATDTGGSTYDISTETDLKSTLNTIAADIKSFAGGVTAAKNVN